MTVQPPYPDPLANGTWQWNVRFLATGQMADPNHMNTAADAKKRFDWLKAVRLGLGFEIVRRWVSDWEVVAGPPMTATNVCSTGVGSGQDVSGPGAAQPGLAERLEAAGEAL